MVMMIMVRGDDDDVGDYDGDNDGDNDDGYVCP